MLAEKHFCIGFVTAGWYKLGIALLFLTGANPMASIRKRTWSTAKGERSAWVVAYLHNGKQHIRTFPTKKAAIEWRAEMTVEVGKGIHTPASTSITVVQAGERWIEQAESDGLEAATVALYRGQLRHHIVPLIGETRLTELNTASIADFRSRLIREGRSQALTNKLVTALGAIIGQAMAQGLAARNPVRDAAQHGARRQRLAKRHEKRLEVGVDIPSKDELRAILGAANGRWRPLIVTVIFTGLRASEIRGLAWDNVDLVHAVLTVRQRADRWNTLGSPKSATSRREVPLAPVVVNTLKEWQLACPKGALGLVFPGDKGRVAPLISIRWQLGKLQMTLGMCRDARHPKYAMHAFRHAAASLFIEQGFSPKRVQALMGHSTIQMTFDVYGHLFPSQDDDQAAMRQLQARLIG